jgi:hypothetical protein
MTERLRWLLIGLGGGLWIAGLAAAVVLFWGDAESDRSDELALAARTAALSRQLGELANELVRGTDPDGTGRNLEVTRSRTNALIARARSAEEFPRVDQLLVSANQSNLAATEDLSGLRDLLAQGRRELAASELVSEEASSDASDLADQMDQAATKASESRRHVLDGLADLRRAVAALSAQLQEDGSLSDEARSQLSQTQANIRELSRQTVSAFAFLGSSTAELQSDLEARAEELTPDVILDCAGDFPNVTEMSVRNMGCEEANGYVERAIVVLAPDSFSVEEFSCSILGPYGPQTGPILGAEDVRCDSGDRAFRFSWGD